MRPQGQSLQSLVTVLNYTKYSFYTRTKLPVFTFFLDIDCQTYRKFEISMIFSSIKTCSMMVSLCDLLAEFQVD